MASTPLLEVASMAAANRRSTQRRHGRRLLLPLTLAMLVFLSFLGQRDVVTSHEARLIQTARQMAAAGWPWEAGTVAVPAVGITRVEGNALRLGPLPDHPPLSVNPWLVPVLNGQIRLQKPPLPYWCDAVLFRLFGFNEALARLPSALMGAAATVLIYDLGRRLLGRRGGLVAALVWVSSHFIIDEYRKAMADPYLAFFTLLCVWAWVAAAPSPQRDSRLRQPPRQATAGWLLLLFYISMALGALAKGPVILLHLGIALPTYHACWRRPVPGRWWPHLAGVAAFAAIALPWPVWVLTALPEAFRLWQYESLGRLGENTENLRQWWFYLPSSMQVALPWTPVLLLSLLVPVMRLRRDRDRCVPRCAPRQRRGLWPVLWYGGTLLALSFLTDMKNAYLLPAMPAQTLLISQGLLWLAAHSRRGHLAADALVRVQGAIGVGFACVMPVLLWGGVGVSAGAWALGGLALLASVRPLRRSVLRQPRQWMWNQAVAYALAVVVFLGAYMPQRDSRRSFKPVAGRIQAMLQEPGTTLLTGSLPEAAFVYLPVGVGYDARAQRVLLVERARGAAQPEEVGSPPLEGGGRVIARRLRSLAGEGRPLAWRVMELTVDRSAAAP